MNKLQQFIQKHPGGFITDADMPKLIKLDRLCPLLVRCGNGRFTTAAQNVAHFIKCVEAGGDYVRDVSFPVGSMERAADWSEEPRLMIYHNAANTKAAGLLAETPANLKPKAPKGWRHFDTSTEFNESECGGVFDGHQVISDADPGL